jgi:predicted acylesterase/phospholipase RssA
MSEHRRRAAGSRRLSLTVGCYRGTMERTCDEPRLDLAETRLQWLRRALPALRARRADRPALPPVLTLALQGGGAHGAFNWGVLDRLLEEPRFRLEAMSGTSAGAMNAVLLASGG